MLGRTKCALDNRVTEVLSLIDAGTNLTYHRKPHFAIPDLELRYFDTPLLRAFIPRSSHDALAFRCSPRPSCLNISSSDDCSTHCSGFSFANSVRIEAAAWLMAHPRPENEISLILSSSSIICISTSSPQTGFEPWDSMSARCIQYLLRGFLSCSRILSLYRSLPLKCVSPLLFAGRKSGKANL